jgi:hypothetical protein
VQQPLHPQPKGSRAGCGHAPFSNFSTGMKKGQATKSQLSLIEVWAVGNDQCSAVSAQLYSPAEICASFREAEWVGQGRSSCSTLI